MPSRFCRALAIGAVIALPGSASAQRDSVFASLATRVRASRPALVEPGPKPYVTLLCKFNDFQEIEPGSRAHFERYFVANEFPSVAHYWNEVANGRFTLDGSQVYGWYVLPRPSTDYVSTFGVNFPLLEQDCTAAADADVHFPDFIGINFIVNTNLDGKLYAGGNRFTLDGVTKDYLATYLDGIVATAIGLAAHEIGHTFGLPHSSGAYGGTYDSCWDVMSRAACYQLPGSPIWPPAHVNAWQKLRLGVIPPARQATAGVGTSTYLLERSARPPDNPNPLVVIVPVPAPTIGAGAGMSEYYLEVRGGPDAGYDAQFAESAVVIHRFINFEGLLVWDVDGNGDPNDDGARWTVGETFIDRENGIQVSIDSAGGTGFHISVTVADRKVLAFSPRGRSRTAPAGSLAPREDSAAVTFDGSGTDGLPWTATASGRSRRLSTSASGAGGGMVRWTEDASVLTQGTYIDTIFVAAGGLANGPGVFADTLVLTAPATLTIGLAARSWRDSLVEGLVSITHNVPVRPTGPDAATAGWTTTKTAPWIELLGGASATGNGAISWRHDATALAPGTYVDTFVVALAAGSVARLVDTLLVLPPLTVSIGRAFGSATMLQASAPMRDSIPITITGPWASSALLNVDFVFGPSFLRGLRPPAGSVWLPLVRSPGTLVPGTYVNRMRVALAADTSVNTYYEDTLHVTAAPPRIVLTKYSGRDTVENASWQSFDSVRVQPEGEGGPNRRWETSAHYDRTNVLFRNGSVPYGSGNGPGWLVWMRNLTGKSPGVYVDTLFVRFASGPGDSAHFIDSLVVTGVPALLITSDSIRRAGVMGADYADTLRAAGGEGAWEWRLKSGALPGGLTLEKNGRVAGIPEASGIFRFVAEVKSGARALMRQFVIGVTAPLLAETAVFDRLLGGASAQPLTEAEVRYLDLQGNRNSRFDIGDARAWLLRQTAGAGGVTP